MRATVASSTPAARPRQPAWAAATTEPSRAANSTGRQSATCTAATTPRVRVMTWHPPPRTGAPASVVAAHRACRAPARATQVLPAGADARRDAAAVLGHGSGRIADVRAEVQRGEGRRAHPAAAQRECGTHARPGAGHCGREVDSAALTRGQPASAASSACMSAGSGASQDISCPVTGCVEPQPRRMQRLAREACAAAASSAA